MKPAEMRVLSDEQLELQYKETTKHLFHLRVASASASDRLETPNEIKKARKDVARLFTIKRERELNAEKAKQAAAVQQGA